MNIIHEVQIQEKMVAITFDDGPNPVYTPQVLEIFQEVNGKATFYMIGEHMVAYPDIVKTVIKQGHEIGNHTYTHPWLTQLTKEERSAEIGRSEEITEELTGKKPATFRPPYLDINDETALIVESFGYPMIGAINFEAKDWEQPGVEHIFEKSREQIRNGSIFLFHDGFGDRSQSIEAVRQLVALLTKEGYQLVTVSELVALQKG